ncbi:MAG TPA: hypothetical protein VN578_18700 [Candidatus Binatia bacterium]|jgi:hypothetical protein|nr:hypothetical protein [Candidatus Binatia bacterium]
MRLIFTATVTSPPRLLLPGILSLLLCSCSTTPPRYRPVERGETFSESRLAPDQFRVSFQGNAETDLGRAYDLALLHSAEIALQNGFACFATVDATNASTLRAYTAHRRVFVENGVYPQVPGPPQPPTPNYQGFAPHGGSFVEVDEPATYFKPGATFTIKCFAEKPEKPFTFDAAPLLQSLKRKYNMPP